MKKDILSWNEVKERYLEFHKMYSFTENMAIDVDFGYWLVNECKQELYSSGEEVSDDEIDKEARKYSKDSTYELQRWDSFMDGAKWIRSKLTRPAVTEEEIYDIIVTNLTTKINLAKALEASKDIIELLNQKR